MIPLQYFLICGLLLGSALIAETAQADLVLSYDVNIVQTGPVTVGSTINWEIFATVSGAPNAGDNFGIASLSVNLTDSFGETLSPGMVGVPFSGYSETSGGTLTAPELEFIGAIEFAQSASTVGDSPGSFLLASGSYIVTQVGMHTLQALDPGIDPSTYFTQAGQQNFESVMYDQVDFGSDSIQVNAVPEPASLAMMGLAACGVMGFRRLRRKTVDSGHARSA